MSPPQSPTPSQVQGQGSPDNPIAALIPFRNVPALISYYLGIFSIIPGIGAPMGIAAVVLGIMGLKRAGASPQSKGKVHAWVGIICGGLFGLMNLMCATLVIAAMFETA